MNLPYIPLIYKYIIYFYQLYLKLLTVVETFLAPVSGDAEEEDELGEETDDDWKLRREVDESSISWFCFSVARRI